MTSFIDTHVHSQYSDCSKVPLAVMVAQADRIGLDGICITDHNCNLLKDEARQLAEKSDCLIIVGAELWTTAGDVLCFGLGRDYNYRGEYEILDIHQVFAENPDCAAVLAHPFRYEHAADLIRVFETCADRFIAIEALNSNCTDEMMARALACAETHGLRLTGGSDAHAPEKIGYYCTAFKGAIGSELDFINALKSGTYYPAHYRSGLG